MKKSILSVIAVALVGVFAFTSCNKDQTKKDFLTQSKGWKMVEATCATGITTTTNNKIYDLMDTENGYFFECEKDDILTFKEDGYVYLMRAVADLPVGAERRGRRGDLRHRHPRNGHPRCAAGGVLQNQRPLVPDCQGGGERHHQIHLVGEPRARQAGGD